jgi:hypothetical protein
MSDVTAIRTRLTVCSTCGHHGRLIIATRHEVISRCHVCGDELRSHPPAVAELPGRAVARAKRRALIRADF